MEKKSTIYSRTIACSFLSLITLVASLLTTKTYAQINCKNEKVIYSETFGIGTTPASNPDIWPTGLTYQDTGSLATEGTYRLSNNTQQKIEWHASEDHTPNNINGRMLVINGQAETFYSHQIWQNFVEGTYIASLFVMNVNTPGTCAPDPLVPVITFRVEYLSQANTWIPLTGSPYSATAVPQTMDPTWVALGSSFSLPNTGTFVVKSIRLILADGTAGGCGNDFALDDIKVSLCPEIDPTPVTFLNINARQKGSGVSVDWSTSQELNSKSFIIEKSADGNSNWNVMASISGAGNSSIVKNYSAFDPQPLKGINFYRIRQVDIDGHFKYSKTVSVKFNLSKTGVSVLSNPFRNLLTVDFYSLSAQVVSARLVDITGKQVAFEKWSINTGSTRKDFTNVNGLQQGIYILTVSGAGGEIIYNNKVIKQ